MGDAFTEGNSWHYSWSVFMMYRGLIDLMGGKETFLPDAGFGVSMPPAFDDSYYGGTIHEIRKCRSPAWDSMHTVTNPSSTWSTYTIMPASPGKLSTGYVEAMNRLYKATPDGYCGDEDNGQTSAYGMFFSHGFYPVCPTSSQYVLGAPTVQKNHAARRMEKHFTVSAQQTTTGINTLQLLQRWRRI